MRRKASDYVRQRRGGRVDPAVLHLKIRVVLTRPMTQDAALALMQRAVDEGEVPDGIEVRWIDWEKGGSGRARAGRVLSSDVASALQLFYGAIASSGQTRFEPVTPPGGRRVRQEEEDEDEE